MKLSQAGLMRTLKTNVVEVKFDRRIAKQGWPASRRMLCTNSATILNSAPGLAALRFKPPTNSPAYDWKSRNLVCTWDLFWQDWRMISVETSKVITVIPVNPPEIFWNYFNIYLQSMSPSEKIDFMSR